MNQRNIAAWEVAISEFKERFRSFDHLYPMPALISFGLVALFVSHLLPGFNPRLGSPAEVVEHPNLRQNPGSIWLSISGSSGKIIINTDDRKMFQWPLALSQQGDLNQLVVYLQGRVKIQLMKSGRDLNANLSEVTATIAVDKHLKYLHLRPLLYALAAAKINRYGFETKTIKNYGLP